MLKPYLWSGNVDQLVEDLFSMHGVLCTFSSTTLIHLWW